MKLNYTSLQHPVEPVERARDCATRQREPSGSTAGRCVLPLHGHLAPAAWAAAEASPGLQARLRADRAAARCRARFAATSPSCASAACSAATSPPPRPTAASTRRLSVAGALDAAANRFGWDAVLVGPGPGIIGSETRLGHGGHGRSRQRPRGARAGAADPALAAPLERRPARPPPRRQPPHPAPCSSSCSAPSTSPVPAGEAVPIAVLADACGWRHRLPRGSRSTSPATPPPALPTRTMGRELDEDPLFFAAALAAGGALRGKG